MWTLYIGSIPIYDISPKHDFKRLDPKDGHNFVHTDFLACPKHDPKMLDPKDGHYIYSVLRMS